MGTKIRCIVLTDVENCWADSGCKCVTRRVGTAYFQEYTPNSPKISHYLTPERLK